MKRLCNFLVALVSVVALTFASCRTAEYNPPVDNGTESPSKLDSDALNILFVGNSMTYYNTLCNVVQGMASRRGHKVAVKATTNGGKNLVFQSTAKNVVSYLTKLSWDVIVFQDIVGSFNGANLEKGAKDCIDLARQTSPDARIILYEPWPVKSDLTGEKSKLDYFTSSYIKTARSNGADLAPAAEAFYDIYSYYGLDYYCDDQKHPQPLGTFVSASTIYYTIFDDENYGQWTSGDQSYLDNLINSNIAYSGNQGKLATYSLEKLNLINELGYYYAHGVRDSVRDKSGKTEYTSAQFGTESGSDVVLPEEKPVTNDPVKITLADPDVELFGSKKENLASKNSSGAQGYASSNLRGGGLKTPITVGNLNDGNKSSYIITNTVDGDTQPWFAIDMKSLREINRIVVTPGADGTYPQAFPTEYEVQIAEDVSASSPADVPGLEWKTVATVENGKASSLSVTFGATKARWIRVLVSSYENYCSLLELEAFAPDTEIDLADVEAHRDILFIGNSYTYYNNLCSVVEGIANYRGHDVTCQSATNGGKNLIFQATADNVKSAVASQKWDLVVLQDHVTNFDSAKLLTGAQDCMNLVKNTSPDAEFLFYATCPRKNAIMTRMKEFTGGYLAAAKKYGAKIAPCGEAYYDAYVYHQQDNYNSDELHPTPLGTFIMASTIYYTMYPQEEKREWTQADYSAVYDIIKNNWAYSDRGKDSSYELSVLNLYNELGYYYAHAILPAVESNEEYVSVVDRGQSASGTQVESSVSSIHIERTVDGTKYLSFADNLAAKTKGVQGYASSNGRNGNGPKTVGNLNDEQKTGTYYIIANTMGTGGTQPDAEPWFALDFGKIVEFNKLLITPGADGSAYPNAYPVEYSVQIVKNDVAVADASEIDGLNWETVATVTGGEKSPLSLTIVTENARWVRLVATKWADNCSLYELEVFAPDTSRTL